MFGKNYIIDLDFDTHELLYIISDFLKSNGISHFNNIEGNKLKGFGDAGMGIFMIEKKIDRDKKQRLYIEANSPMSADILKNLVDAALEHIEENKLYEVKEEDSFEEDAMSLDDNNKEKEVCKHDYEIIKQGELLGVEVDIYQCKKCNKLEFYKR